MKSWPFGSAAARLLVLLGTVTVTDAHVAGDVDHPVVGVIELLKSLKNQVVSEGKSEEVTYSKFETWCSDSSRSLEKAVQSGKQTVDILSSKVESLEKQNATLTEEIAQLTEEIAKQESLAAAAATARQDENKLYTEADKDLAETVSAFEAAITELTSAKSSAGNFLQVTSALRGASSLLSQSQRQRVAAALKDVPDFLAKGDFGSHVKPYKFKSDNVVDLLKELKMTFEDQRVDGTKHETASANAYELAKSARDSAMAAASESKSTKTTALGECQGTLATAQGELDGAEADLAADQISLSETKKDCSMKKDEWEQRTKTRALELEAIEEGITILGKVTGVRTEAPSNPLPPMAPTTESESLLQSPSSSSSSFSSSSFSSKNPKERALRLLRQEAIRQHSKSFETFADQLASKLTASPFAEVNNMIQKMIFRLMDEQKNEDEHKNWCDLELSKTNTSIEDKTAKVSEIDLKMQADQATVAALASEITAANDKVAEFQAFIDDSTQIRQESKAENEAAIHDAQQAQNAIAKAVAVLEAFYKDSGMVAKESWEFVQKSKKAAAPVDLPEKPSTWEAGYSGVSDPKNQPEGIITVLEKISADFSSMEADTKAQEATDEKNYQDSRKEAEVEMARRQKEGELKTQEKARLTDKLTALQRTKKRTTAELEATQQYLKDLHPACVEGDSTYEERKGARDSEIQALKEAQVILSEAFKSEEEEPPSLVEIRRANFAIA